MHYSTQSVSYTDLIEYDTIEIGGPLDTIQEVESMPSLSPPECSPISSLSSSPQQRRYSTTAIPEGNLKHCRPSSGQFILDHQGNPDSRPPPLIPSTSTTTTPPSEPNSRVPNFSSSNNEHVQFPKRASCNSSSPLLPQHDSRRVWVEHPTLGYAPATITKTLDNGKIVVSVDVTNSSDDSFTMNAFESVPVHPSCLQGVPDLLALGEFDLGPLLHNIRVRYFKNEIYTSIGLPILISVNPYKPIPKLYSSETASKYRNLGQIGTTASLETDLLPHPFHIAQIALSSVFNGKSDQSIIISGESGAGKTEATKIILSYLAGGDEGINVRALGRELGYRSTERLPEITPSHDTPEALSVETQITRSNPVLESFGNAKTLRNDNSSRFGKFTQILFDTSTQKLVGARISNYLLEKCRIVTQQEDERNYHIFYQLCAGRYLLNIELQEHLSLDDSEYYDYLNRCTFVQGRDDVEDFCQVVDCLSGLGFNGLQSEIWSLLAGILHLGNVKFQYEDENSNDNEKIDIIDLKPFKKSCELFNIPEDRLRDLLTIKSIRDAQSRVDIKKRRTLEDVIFARDALCKAIYEKLFHWLVCQINGVLDHKRPQYQQNRRHRKNASLSSSRHQLTSIGLLDIFGFEIFEVNSFEQLCINFANEQLQQHFNSHVFREEQALYVGEGIDWSQIKFEDNKKILDSLTNKVTGVFPTLDSECLMPKGTDTTFLRKMIALSDKCAIILKPSSLKLNEQFGISHYAGPVFYNSFRMLDKNRDRVHQEVFDAFDTYGTKLLQEIFSDISNGFLLSSTTQNNRFSSTSAPSLRRPTGSVRGFANATVSFTFREQLTELMNVLGVTTASYIRCIKPNSKKAELTFDSLDILRQLKCAGMLESIRIRKAGYPIRFELQQFLTRYRVLLSPNQICQLSQFIQNSDTEGLRQLSRQLSQWIESNGQIIRNEDVSPLWQVGKTKVFMKDKLQTEAERLAASAWSQSATVISKYWRCHREQTKYQRLKDASIVIQSNVKRIIYQTRFKAYVQPRRHAAIKIQATWKGYQQREIWYNTLYVYRKIKAALMRYRMRMRLTSLAQRYRENCKLTDQEWDLGHAFLCRLVGVKDNCVPISGIDELPVVIENRSDASLAESQRSLAVEVEVQCNSNVEEQRSKLDDRKRKRNRIAAINKSKINESPSERHEPLFDAGMTTKMLEKIQHYVTENRRLTDRLKISVKKIKEQDEMIKMKDDEKERLENENESLQEKIDALESELIEKNNMEKTYESQMNEVLIHMEETYKHQADYKIGKENSAKENKELKKQNTLLKMALEKQGKELKSLQAKSVDSDQLKEELDYYKNRIDEYENEYREMEGELNAAQMKIKELKQEMEKSEHERNKNEYFEQQRASLIQEFRYEFPDEEYYRNESLDDPIIIVNSNRYKHNQGNPSSPLRHQFNGRNPVQHNQQYYEGMFQSSFRKRNNQYSHRSDEPNSSYQSPIQFRQPIESAREISRRQHQGNRDLHSIQNNRHEKPLSSSSSSTSFASSASHFKNKIIDNKMIVDCCQQDRSSKRYESVNEGLPFIRTSPSHKSSFP